MPDRTMEAEPGTFERIAQWAARDPARLAIAERQTRLSFGDLHAYAQGFTHLFREAGIQRGDRVALAQPGFAAELIATLACENLGAVPASCASRNDDDAQRLFERVDWVLSEHPLDVPAGRRTLLLDAAFVARSKAPALRQAPGTPPVRVLAHEPQRLLRTSGSTGRARWMLLPRAAQEARLRIHEQSRRFGPAATLVAAPFVVNAALLHAVACLRQGSPVAQGRLAELQGVAIGTFWGLPLHLENFLADIEAGAPIARPVDVRLVGGFVSPQLRERARQLLGGGIANPYGTNEVGIVCDSLDDDGAGDVLPGIEVRILDAAGRALRAGEGGGIAVRAAGAVPRYEDDPEATAQAFRDGWFITGDHGMWVAPGRLRIEGRHDDLVAIGGQKVPARAIEDRLRAIAGVVDVAVCALRADARGAAVGIALVAGLDAQQGIVERIGDVLDRRLTALVRYRFLDALPRTGNGKVDRVALARLIS